MKNIHPDDVCFNDVIAPQDIALYGGLCALATFDRSELASKVIDDVAFKQFLELAPDARVLAFPEWFSRSLIYCKLTCMQSDSTMVKRLCIYLLGIIGHAHGANLTMPCLCAKIQELIFDFYGSRYSSCLAIMEKIKGDITLDM
jgi:hypothetical protein